MDNKTAALAFALLTLLTIRSLIDMLTALLNLLAAIVHLASVLVQNAL
jgi:hypothetical protein